MERRESSVVSSGRQREREGEKKGLLAFVTPAFMCDYLVYFKYNHIYTRTQTQQRRTHTHTNTHTLVFGHLVVFIGLTVLVVVVFSAPADRTVTPTVAACAVQAETSPSLWFFVFCNLFPAFHSIYTHTH